MMNHFEPPPFRQHRWIRGGHLQTIASIGLGPRNELPTVPHIVGLSDGDSIVLHEDLPASWRSGDRSILLLHGLCGCHEAGYMLRLAEIFFHSGFRVFRLDMRGCGAAAGLAQQLTHAGRSDDVIAALETIAGRAEAGKIGAIGVSLGGNQLLRAMGRIGAQIDTKPAWFDRIDRIAAVSPPLDLPRCSDNMERLILRPYNRYFIRQLLSRVPTQVRQRPDFQEIIAGRRPRTLRELDELITAPLSGFRDAADYYDQASANRVTAGINVKTLVITAADDPVVPVGCFTDDPKVWSASTQLLVSPRGGHVGFIDQQKRSWMDQVLAKWFDAKRP